MPTATFENLPADKRARFVEAALDEFASAPLDRASITAIVKRLGIAKGSVYQYFADKFELYTWLLQEAGGRRAVGYADLEVPEGADWFDRLAVGYRAGLRQHAADPRWARLGLRLFEPSEEPRLVALRRETEARIHAWLVDQLREAQGRCEVRADLDVDVAAWLVQGTLQHGLLAAFLAKLGTDIDGLPGLAPRVTDAQLEGALAVADEAVRFLRRALGPG